MAIIITLCIGVVVGICVAVIAVVIATEYEPPRKRKHK